MSFAVSLETRPEFLNINKNDRRIPSTIRTVDPTKIQLKKISHKFDIPERQKRKKKNVDCHKKGRSGL